MLIERPSPLVSIAVFRDQSIKKLSIRELRTVSRARLSDREENLAGLVACEHMLAIYLAQTAGTLTARFGSPRRGLMQGLSKLSPVVA